MENLNPFWAVLRCAGPRSEANIELDGAVVEVPCCELAADQAKGSKKAHSGSFVYTWGMGYHGQLGRKFSRGEIRMCLQPNPVSLPAGVSACQVACGAFHTMVLTLDGRVFSWGEGRHGQLGYSSLAKHQTPMDKEHGEAVQAWDEPRRYIT